MIRTDSHVHTRYCRHAIGEVADYVKSAEEKGLEYVGFADHLPLPPGFKDPSGDLAMPKDELPRYMGDVKKESGNNGLQIAAGIEADYMLGYEKQTGETLKKNGFDFVIGSVHFIDGWNFDYTEEVFREGMKKYADADEPYYEYYSLVKKMVRSGMFDIVGHIDLIKKFGYAPKKSDPEGIGEILDLAKKKGMAVEINTAGMDKKIGEQYPSEEIIGMCFERDIEMTVGSDAHAPAELGRHFEKAEGLLKKAGYTSIVTFNKRKKTQVPL